MVYLEVIFNRYMKNVVCFLVLTLSFFGFSQENSQEPKDKEQAVVKRSYVTKKIVGSSPEIDGVLSDPAWETVAWESNFVQWTPKEGETPSYPTKFKVLYDEQNIYFGIVCIDDEPEKIVKRLSRRDGFEGDWVEINIDSYHDLRTAFFF